MKLRLSAPEQLVDLSGIKELTGITKNGNAITISAMSRHLDVANNADVKAAYPALADLASRIGDRQVRAMGTIGEPRWITTTRRRATQRGARLGRDRGHARSARLRPTISS